MERFSQKNGDARRFQSWDETSRVLECVLAPKLSGKNIGRRSFLTCQSLNWMPSPRCTPVSSSFSKFSSAMTSIVLFPVWWMNFSFAAKFDSEDFNDNGKAFAEAFRSSLCLFVFWFTWLKSNNLRSWWKLMKLQYPKFPKRRQITKSSSDWMHLFNWHSTQRAKHNHEQRKKLLVTMTVKRFINKSLLLKLLLDTI